MGIFFKAEHRVRGMIQEYLDRVDACIEQFARGMMYHLGDARGVHDPAADQTHRLESRADDLRRDIEMTLYGRALLPDSRGDILEVLEALDRIPNAAEQVLRMLDFQRIVIPEELHPGFATLLDRVLECCRLARKGADTLFENPKQTPYVVKEVDVAESRADRAEQRLVIAIFEGARSTSEKILLRDVVTALGRLADRSENAADRIGIVAIKRRI